MLIRGNWRFFLSLACVVLAGCSGSSSGSPRAIATVQVDAELGGTLSVDRGPLKGLRLVVSPGSLTEDLVLEVGLSTSTVELAYSEVGPAARFFPAFTIFSPPAILIMPFDLELVPAGVSDEELMVRKRAFNRTRAGSVPLGVDREQGFISIPIPGFDDLASFWVARQRRDADIEIDSFLPRGGLEIYWYSDGTQIRLRTPSSHPNLHSGGLITEMAFIDGDGEGGFYLLRQADGDIDRAGEYFLGGQGYQEVHDLIPWVRGQLQGGGSVATETDYVAFAPFGSMTQVYTGQVMTSTRVELLFDGLETQAGEFSDVLRIEWQEEFTDSRGGSGSFELVLLLAQGIGPVGYSLDQGPMHLLTHAQIGGRALGPLALVGKAR